MSSSYTPDPNSDQFIEKLNFFEQKHRPFISLVIKPLLTLLLFLSMGYYSMYMSTTYVKQDKFNAYVLTQTAEVQTRSVKDQANHEKVVSKLDEIIKNEARYESALEYFNKSLQALHEVDVQMNERLTYDERFVFNPSSHNNKEN